MGCAAECAGHHGSFRGARHTRITFGNLAEDLDLNISASTKESTLLGNEEAKLRVFNEDVEDFITASLIQGRAQYPAGTPERAFIEAVPTDPST